MPPFRRGFEGNRNMSFSTSLAAALTALEAAPASAYAGISNLFGGVKNTVTPMLANVIANYNNPTFVTTEVNLILMVQNINNFPNAVAGIKTLPMLCAAAAADPTKMSELVSLVGGIESQL
jgi:hypothetical protein